MLKKTIIAVIVLLLVAAGSVWWYFRPKQPVTKISESIRSVPINAAFIIETKHAKSLKQKLNSTNKFWSGLNELDFFKTLNGEINSIDSLILGNSKINNSGDSVSILVSAHPMGVNAYEFLFTVGIPANLEAGTVDEFVKSCFNGAEIKQRSYDEVTIFTVETSKGKLNYAIHKNVLLMSFGSMLIEDAVRQLNNNTSLLNNSTFERLLRAQSAASDFNVYLNLNLLPGYMDQFFSNIHQPLVSSLKYFNDWIVLDGNIKNDAFTFNGFSASGDSVNNFLDLFKEQEPQQIELFKIAPENTTLLLHYGISNFRVYYNSYKKYLEGQHRFFDYQKGIDELKSNYHIDLEKNFFDHIEKEMGLIIKTSVTDDPVSNSYAVFREDNVDAAFSALKTVSDSIIRKQKLKRDLVG